MWRQQGEVPTTQSWQHCPFSSLFLLCHALFQQDPFFGVCQEGYKSLNWGVWSISVSSVCRLRSPSHVLSANQILFQSVFPALQRDACHHCVWVPDVCWQFYPFHIPASARCGVKSISYMKDTDSEKGSDLCESIQEVCSKVGKKILLWLCLHEQVVGHCRNGL